MAQEALNHRVYLVRHLELAKVARTNRPTIDDRRQPLGHEMGRIARRSGRQMERRHLALCRQSWAIERDPLPHGAGGHVTRRGQHHRLHVLDELTVRGRQEHVRDELPAELLIARLHGCHHRLDTRPFRRGSRLFE